MRLTFLKKIFNLIKEPFTMKNIRKEMVFPPISQIFEKWDRGSYLYSVVEESIKRIQKGKHFGKKTLNLLSQCTICPVGNSSCCHSFEIVINGFHPQLPAEIKKIRICPYGCNQKNCLLNK